MSIIGIEAEDAWNKHEKERQKEISGRFEAVCANCGEIRNYSVRPVECGEVWKRTNHSE